MPPAQRLNCWEFMNCGMEPGGIFAATNGPCPVAEQALNKNGDPGGRPCWEIMPGSSRSIRHTCRFTRKSCHECPYYQRIQIEEQADRFEETIAGM